MYNSSDPNDKRRYIGSTIDPGGRLYTHMTRNSFLKNSADSIDWSMKTLPEFNVRTRKDLNVIEFVYIYLCEFFNIHLLNTHKGGNSLSNHKVIDENYETILEGIKYLPLRASHVQLANKRRYGYMLPLRKCYDRLKKNLDDKQD